MNIEMGTFIEIIEKTMKNNKITATEIETHTGVKRQSITAWKNGTMPSLENAIKVIKYLGLSADEIFDIKPTKKTVLTTIPPDYITIRSDLEYIAKGMKFSLDESDIEEKDSLIKNTLKITEKTVQKINNAIKNINNIT